MPSNDYAAQTKRGEMHGWCVYVLYEIEGPYTKIGTAANVNYRISGLRDGNPRRLELHRSWRVKSRLEAFTIEREALRAAALKRVQGRDWVLLSHALAAKLVESAAADLGILIEEITA